MTLRPAGYDWAFVPVEGGNLAGTPEGTGPVARATLRRHRRAGGSDASWTTRNTLARRPPGRRETGEVEPAKSSRSVGTRSGLEPKSSGSRGEPGAMDRKRSRWFRPRGSGRRTLRARARPGPCFTDRREEERLLDPLCAFAGRGSAQVTRTASSEGAGGKVGRARGRSRQAYCIDPSTVPSSSSSIVTHSPHSSSARSTQRSL